MYILSGYPLWSDMAEDFEQALTEIKHGSKDLEVPNVQINN